MTVVFHSTSTGVICLNCPLVKKTHLCKHLAESTEAPETLLVKREILLDFAVISTRGLKPALSPSFLALEIWPYNCFQLVTHVLSALLFLDAWFFHGGRKLQSLVSKSPSKEHTLRSEEGNIVFTVHGWFEQK